MKTIRMKWSMLVEGIGRRAGDLVTVPIGIAHALVTAGRAEWVEERRDARPVSPNRMKFASLVAKLDPHAEDYYQQVTTLQADYEHRERTARKLMTVLVDQEADMQQILRPGDTALLLDALRAAIERFVVERY